MSGTNYIYVVMIAEGITLEIGKSKGEGNAMLTVSRSVDRVFQIMELFSAKRRPLSATEIRQSLSMPHSSAVSVLSRLVALGYLNQNAETKRFFPSLRLHRLCESVPEAIIGGNPLAQLVDLIQSKVCLLYTSPSPRD